MGIKIQSVRFTQPLDMSRIQGGYSTQVANEGGANSQPTGVRASIGVVEGTTGLVLSKTGQPLKMFVPLGSSLLMAVIYSDDAEVQVKK